MTKIDYSIRYNIVNGKKKLTREYISWLSMRTRCNKPSHDKYKFYGGRGIKVCDRWQNSFENFLEDMGRSPSKDHQIDRVDNSKGYSPDNCKWETRKNQCNNTRRNVHYTHNGETKTLAEWADFYGIRYRRFWHRLKQGMSFSDCVSKVNLITNKKLESKLKY